MVRQRGAAESYAARNRDFLIATAPWTTRASARRRARVGPRAYDAPSEPPPQQQERKPFAPLGTPGAGKPTGDPRRDAARVRGRAARAMATPKGAAAPGLRRAARRRRAPSPRAKAPPRGDVQAPGPSAAPTRCAPSRAPPPLLRARAAARRAAARGDTPGTWRGRCASARRATAHESGPVAAAAARARRVPRRGGRRRRRRPLAADEGDGGPRAPGPARRARARPRGRARRASPPRPSAPPARGAAAREVDHAAARRGPGQDRRAKARAEGRARGADARTARPRRRPTGAARRTPPRTRRAAKEAEDRRRREEGERAKKRPSSSAWTTSTRSRAGREEAAEPAPRGRTTPLQSQAPRSPRPPPSRSCGRRGRRRSSTPKRGARRPRRLQYHRSRPEGACASCAPRRRRAPSPTTTWKGRPRTSRPASRRAQRFQDDRRRRVARRAAQAGRRAEALAEKIQQAPDLRTLAGLPPRAAPGRRRRRPTARMPRTTGARRSRASRRSCRCRASRAPRRPTTSRTRRRLAGTLSPDAMSTATARPPRGPAPGAPGPRRAHVSAPEHRRAVPRRRVVLPRVHRPRRRGHHLARAAGDVRGPRGPDPRRVV